MGKNLQGGFRTAEQANRSWMMHLTEWALEPVAGNWFWWKRRSYTPGLNTSTDAAHIIVYHRYKQVLEEARLLPLACCAHMLCSISPDVCAPGWQFLHLVFIVSLSLPQ
jgi:hypothetical protein